MAFVLDCSMTMAWVFPDEATVQTDAIRDSLLEETAFVPGLWSVEVANVLLVATRRGRIAASDWPVVIGALSALPIEVDPETSERALADSLQIAQAHDLSSYDALYLEVALRRTLPLATIDRKLAAAADAAGVAVLGA